jgi:hypothetical protein
LVLVCLSDEYVTPQRPQQVDNALPAAAQLTVPLRALVPSVTNRNQLRIN